MYDCPWDTVLPSSTGAAALHESLDRCRAISIDPELGVNSSRTWVVVVEKYAEVAEVVSTRSEISLYV